MKAGKAEFSSQISAVAVKSGVSKMPNIPKVFRCLRKTLAARWRKLQWAIKSLNTPRFSAPIKKSYLFVTIVQQKAAI